MTRVPYAVTRALRLPVQVVEFRNQGFSFSRCRLAGTMPRRVGKIAWMGLGVVAKAHQQVMQPAGVNIRAVTRGEWLSFCVKGAVFRAFDRLSQFDEIKHRQRAARDLN